MIRNFADAETGRIWSSLKSRVLPFAIQNTALRKLRLMNQARTVEDLCVPPGNRIERLKVNREGEYRIRINDHWRICFVWHETAPKNVETVDYH